MIAHRAFLEVAEELSDGSSEAHWRSAVSRAYYACYHTARWLLQTCGFRPPEHESAHAYLWRRLSNSGHPDIESVGKQMNSFRQTRNRADYDLDHSIDQETALEFVYTVEKIIDVLEIVPTLPSVQEQITEAIKKYEREVLREVTWHEN